MVRDSTSFEVVIFVVRRVISLQESREYARRSPSTKFDAGHGGTFSGEPGRRSRPAETSQDSTEPRSLALCPVLSLDVIARS
jgi:hypothetical protein